MSLVSLRPLIASGPALPAALPAPSPAAPPVTQPAPHDRDTTLAMELLRDGGLPPHALITALSRQTPHSGRLIDLILSRSPNAETALYTALARLNDLTLADLGTPVPDSRLIDRIGAEFCLSHSLIPWQRTGGVTVIAVAYPSDIPPLRTQLAASFGPITFALAPPARITAALLATRGHKMAEGAETRVSLSESCRAFRRPSTRALPLAVAFALVCILAARPMLALVTLWAILTLIFSMGLKLAATLAALRPQTPEPDSPAIVARLPVVSIMVALYRESSIAARLIQRLGRLDYPADLLDIVLIVEASDHPTRSALARADLPATMRVVTVPQGRVKTKPRALNFGLSQCRGSIVGVYDAEDAPQPDQIRKVVDRFHQRGQDVACLQGVLDFYNPHRNWLSRCFTVEYASWFRVILPGLQRLGLPLPLGGTTLFFRRDVLERLGGWDAHNVTEDADLGIRLARHGYRTEILATTTYEEANCRAVPWVKQRSRWLKGYMMTYLTHMRRPRLLWQQLGPRGFLGFQILFLGSLSQAVLLPVLWSFWALALGLGHPLQPYLTPALITAVTGLFVAAEAVNIATGMIGLRRSGQRLSLWWVPTLTLYFPLQALAAYKALWEMLRRPFYWDKTSHGAFSEAVVQDPDLARSRKARIQATISAPSVLSAAAIRPRPRAVASRTPG